MRGRGKSVRGRGENLWAASCHERGGFNEVLLKDLDLL